MVCNFREKTVTHTWKNGFIGSIYSSEYPTDRYKLMVMKLFLMTTFDFFLRIFKRLKYFKAFEEYSLFILM